MEVVVESPSPLSEANTAFALALFKKLSDGDKTGNVFLSPFSISSALAMVMLGARGNTAVQMSEVLCFTGTEKSELPGEQQLMQMHIQQQVECKIPPHILKKTKNLQDDVDAAFEQLLRELNKQDAPYALSVANRLYGEQSYQFLKEFLESTRKYYNAELESVNFKTEFEAARVTINDWVESKTQGKIKDLLAQGVLNSMTKLVLVNAIYFKGTWDEKFEEEYTEDAEFRINKNDKKQVKMMYQESKFPFTSIPEVSCQVIEMPYKGKELSMLILLPDEIEDSTTGLEKLESELTYEKFVEWTRPDKMDVVSVEVKLPRFKLEEKYDMKDVLISMGMVDAFNPSMSDFSGMSPNNDLFISEVVHKAFVEVNEKGTEAAAATGVIGVALSFQFSKSFTADHPFLFFIRHNPSMSILFAGRYCSPE